MTAIARTGVPTLLDMRERIRLSIYAKMNWWVSHFVDVQFVNWPLYLHVAQHVTPAVFAERALRRGARAFGGPRCEFENEHKALTREIERWLCGAEPSAVTLATVCEAWSVPMDRWMLNPDRRPSER